MRATVMYGAGDVRVENVAGARLIEPTDALVTVSRAAITTRWSPARPAAAWDAGETWTAIGVDSNGYIVVGGGGSEDNNYCTSHPGPTRRCPTTCSHRSHQRSSLPYSPTA